MRPISELSRADVAELRGFAFDLDDTLLDSGSLSESAYAALFRLREVGLELYGVTGRPVGWAELLCRLFPVRAVIAENGALACVREGERVRTLDSVPANERARRRARLAETCQRVRARFPQLQAADDVAARISDFTFDIGEHHTVDSERVREVSEFVRAEGARVFTSSVHLHVTYDFADKASGAVRLFSEHSGLDSTRVRGAYAFIGDSENDAPCFAAFSLTIGVRNLRGRPTLRPRFLTTHEKGRGFAEAAETLVRLRQSL